MGWDGICHLVCVCRVICKLCGMAPLAAVTLWEGGINFKELREQGVCAKEKIMQSPEFIMSCVLSKIEATYDRS